MLIYRELLCLNDPSLHISYPAALVDARRLSLLLPHFQSDVRELYRLNTSTTILSTCRRVYQEALPILYGENEFFFNDYNDLQCFQTAGLATTRGKLWVWIIAESLADEPSRQ